MAKIIQKSAVAKVYLPILQMSLQYLKILAINETVILYQTPLPFSIANFDLKIQTT